MAETTTNSALEINCKSCGAMLKYAPGTNHLKCEYCGGENEIKSTAAPVVEIDFQKGLNESKMSSLQEISTISCGSCGATTTFDKNVISGECGYCDTPLVLTNASKKSVLKPNSILPFQIDQKKAQEYFQKWVKGLWFAPNDLKMYAKNTDKLKGMYVPYWTYDCNTTSYYTGEQGINRQETEYYTETVNGKEVSRTRTVTVTDWYRASGTVYENFDDLLVIASKSLPTKYAEKLEPWDLKSVIPFEDQYLAGFVAETYQIGLEEGFDKAKEMMVDPIRSKVRKDIGGDNQRIHSVDTQHNDIKFKHTLLPIWISAYKYNGKLKRFLINGRTGEVQGERPWSWIKIALTVLGAIAVIIALIMIFGG